MPRQLPTKTITLVYFQDNICSILFHEKSEVFSIILYSIVFYGILLYCIFIAIYF